MLGTKVRISEHNTKGNKNFLDKKDHLLCKVAKEIKKMSTYTEKKYDFSCWCVCQIVSLPREKSKFFSSLTIQYVNNKQI